MHLTELTEPERIALMGLLKLTISADSQLTEGESKVLVRIADELGRATFAESRQKAEAALRCKDDIQAALSAVTRPEARTLLYELALEAAEQDELLDAEAEVLEWVGELWGQHGAG